MSQAWRWVASLDAAPTLSTSYTNSNSLSGRGWGAMSQSRLLRPDWEPLRTIAYVCQTIFNVRLTSLLHPLHQRIRLGTRSHELLSTFFETYQPWWKMAWLNLFGSSSYSCFDPFPYPVSEAVCLTTTKDPHPAKVLEPRSLGGQSDELGAQHSHRFPIAMETAAHQFGEPPRFTPLEDGKRLGFHQSQDEKTLELQRFGILDPIWFVCNWCHMNWCVHWCVIADMIDFINPKITKITTKLNNLFQPSRGPIATCLWGILGVRGAVQHSGSYQVCWSSHGWDQQSVPYPNRFYLLGKKTCKNLMPSGLRCATVTQTSSSCWRPLYLQQTSPKSTSFLDPFRSTMRRCESMFHFFGSSEETHHRV